MPILPILLLEVSTWKKVLHLDLMKNLILKANEYVQKVISELLPDVNLVFVDISPKSIMMDYFNELLIVIMVLIILDL